MSGFPLGLRCRNPGNIVTGQHWQGEIGASGRFAVFDTMENGIRALALNLIAYSKHDDGHGGKIDTVAEAISRWAPSSDNNDTSAYIHFVCTVLECGPDDVFDFTNKDFLFWMVTAIGEQENGHDPFTESVTDAQIEEGVARALAVSGV
jgi:hypothetical protein